MSREEILAQLDTERATLALYATAEVRQKVIERRIDPLLEELTQLADSAPAPA